MTGRVFAGLGAANAAVAVAAGAFGAHALRGRLPADLLAVFETGARYHMYHALGLIAVAWCAAWRPGACVSVAGWLMVAGILLFSGSLYALALTGTRGFGAITPLGGTAWIAAWVTLTVSMILRSHAA
jgi:uncharacterized membrane protein YgdD (TMEM256/DUF423 family)